MQAELEEAIAKVADHEVSVSGSGRTDAGVHALGQVAHFESRSSRTTSNWVLGLNSSLPQQISVLWASEPLGDDFHARFSASMRTYLYRIRVQPVRPAIERNQVTWVRSPLDVAAMRSAASALIGEHDFSTFRAAGCQARTPVREIRSIELLRADNEIRLRISANAFLLHMVRNIVGSLLLVGRAERPVAWLGEILLACDRTRAGPTAKPHGLYLERVSYPERFALPQ